MNADETVAAFGAKQIVSEYFAWADGLVTSPSRQRREEWLADRIAKTLLACMYPPSFAFEPRPEPPKPDAGC